MRVSRLIRVFLAMMTLPLLAVAYALLVYTETPVDPDWEVAGSNVIPESAVTVRFSGTATLTSRESFFTETVPPQ